MNDKANEGKIDLLRVESIEFEFFESGLNSLMLKITTSGFNLQNEKPQALSILLDSKENGTIEVIDNTNKKGGRKIKTLKERLKQ